MILLMIAVAVAWTREVRYVLYVLLQSIVQLQAAIKAGNQDAINTPNRINIYLGASSSVVRTDWSM